MSNSTSSPASNSDSSNRATALTAAAIRLARADPVAFLRYLLLDPAAPADPMPEVHAALQNHLSAHRLALVELPRDHGKTTQVCLRVLWELGRAPNLRIKIVCASEAIAVDRSRFLRRSIEQNRRLALVFPHLRKSRPWTAPSFAVERGPGILGPSVAAFGIGAASTGTRADLLICDDVVDVKALHSKAHRDRVAEDFTDNLFNLLEPTGRFWGLSTPWHNQDLNARLKANPSYSLFRRAIGPNLEPVWPEKWSARTLADRRAAIGESSFARGYRLLAIGADEVTIRPEWIRFWDDEIPRERFDRVLLSVDPALSAQATADATGLVVLGKIGAEIRVLMARGVRVPTHRLLEILAGLDRGWQPDVILFESNAAFDGIRDLFLRHTAFGGRLQGVKQHKAKAIRMGNFAVPVENGTVRLKGRDGAVDAGQRQLFHEMTAFPFGDHDDLADAAASGAEHLLAAREPRLWG